MSASERRLRILRIADNSREAIGGKALYLDAQQAVRGPASCELHGKKIIRQCVSLARSLRRFSSSKRDRTELPPDKPGAESLILRPDQGLQRGHAFPHRNTGHRGFSMQLPGGGAGASREGKKMQVSEWLRSDEAVALLEVGLRLTWETDHHVRADGGVRHRCPDRLQPVGIVPRAVAAMHFAQGAIGPRL